MGIPVVKGVIDRRILVNYRVDPEVLQRFLPRPFRPKLAGEHGMAGVCLIRLKGLRPRFVPSILGVSSENAAHRIAVEWEEGGRQEEGVYIPRRDSSSWLNALAGGRLFPGEHHHARFRVVEEGGRFQVALDSDDGRTHLAIDAKLSADLPPGSVFPSLEAASRFFEKGSVGYSATSRPDGRMDGLVLKTSSWRVEPLAVAKVESSFFEDPGLFPRGSAKLDCALLMRGIEHEWHGREPLCPGRPD